VVDVEVLRRRLDALASYLERIQKFSNVDRDQFVQDPDVHHLAERYLHLAMETVLDLANHLIADAGFEAPETYRNAFAVLAQHGVIDLALGQRLQAWAGFRNVLVHAYLAIDHGLAWDVIANDLDDLRQFAAIVARHL
jgi:uncharacterized protein YutE (UPF0331/DUF86 family)